MKNVLVFILLILGFSTSGQTFSFPMYFSDALGNKNTLVIGYDINASYGIDSAFGEENIITEPMDSVFDIRLTNYMDRNNDHLPVDIHTKKQIIKYHCFTSLYHQIELDIKAKHWPVTAYWDRTLFSDPCRHWSVFTGVSPGGWWDTGCPSSLDVLNLNSIDSVTFTSNRMNDLNDSYDYVTDGGDTLDVFWITFSHRKIEKGSVKDLRDARNFISVYPNPAGEKINFKLEMPSFNPKRVEIYNSLGQMVLQSDQWVDLDISTLTSGIYFAKMNMWDGMYSVSEFLKL